MHVIDNIKTIHDGWGRFHLVTMKSPDGTEHPRQVEDHGDACCVLPYDPERHVVTLVRQPRVGPLFKGGDGMLLEAPAGLTDGEDPAEAVRNSVVLEEVAKMGAIADALNPKLTMNPHLVKKHFGRKHGPNAYYGQK